MPSLYGSLGKLSDEKQWKDIVTINRIPEYLKACGLVMVRPGTSGDGK